MRWLHDRSIGQKFFLFRSHSQPPGVEPHGTPGHLSRINSYVDRHKRITVPAIVTAAEMQRSAHDMNLTLHLFSNR